MDVILKCEKSSFASVWLASILVLVRACLNLRLEFSVINLYSITFFGVVTVWFYLACSDYCRLEMTWGQNEHVSLPNCKAHRLGLSQRKIEQSQYAYIMKL